MIYLDYAANTPTDEEVLSVFCQVNQQYFGNPNGKYKIGQEASRIIEEASAGIKELLCAPDMEVVYTSGASEANNLAVKGCAKVYREQGKHIITTCLEHSSVSGALTFLQTQGYEIDLVDITSDGCVELSHLKELLREDTILVSLCYVDSELGTLQPIREIGELLKEYPNCSFHVDATQAVGKVPVTCENIDFLTFAPHKFYGINGMGVLLKKEELVLEPLIHGGNSTTIYRSGTPVAAFAAATHKALELCIRNLDERNLKVEKIRSRILRELENYPLVRINSPNQAIPHFLNVSIEGVKSARVQEELDKNEVYISPKSACSTPHTPSRAVYAITKDKKNALWSFRISFSHLLEAVDVERFLSVFKECYAVLTLGK